MVSSPLLPSTGRLYVGAVVLAGFAVVTWCIHDLTAHPIGYRWFLLAALTLISGSATVRLPSVPASISISETFVCAAVLLYGPSAGTLVVALDGLVISFWISTRQQELYRALFNMSAPAVSAWGAAQLFFWVSGIAPLVASPAPLNRVLPALVVFAVAYFSFNSWLIAFAIALEKQVSPVKVWRQHFVWLSLNYFCGASVAVLLVVGTRQIDLRIVGVIIPLLLVLYFTFKTSMDRVEDANRHVQKVNGLYLSTIETLALAIDAKDQVTHGHIRRVQRYTVGLARELGVVDATLLKAIEAAALLHDMGKLAVPEYILNKPGKLTDAEFEQMKLHASAGAEILSAIDFPYPVVPIVRHHHESWDGSGYPDGLRGTDIPIGARILSVVDCFDALTSDRPYRKKLSNAEALKILNDRKGSMYDPWVVQTFERVHAALEAEVNSAVPSGLSEAAKADDPQQAHAHSVGAQKSAAMLPSQELAIVLECEALLLRIRQEVPAEVVIFYRYDSQSNRLVADHVAADACASFVGMTIGIGDCLSGWVAVNKQSIVNSDAALDLGVKIDLVRPRLRNALGLPVCSNNHLVGVMTLYSSQSFTSDDEHNAARMVEEIVRYAESASIEREMSFALKIAG